MQVRSRFSIAMVTILLLARCSPVFSAIPADLEKSVQAIAQSAIESNSTVGLSIGIAKGDEIVLAQGYGLADVELKSPATRETVYRIGSITKQFTAAAILLLVEEKRLALDDPLTKYLPDYPTQGHTVTIRHLLQHTSGIKSFTDLPTYRKLLSQAVTHEDILNRFQNEPFHFDPGTKYRYCNSGFYLLGMVVEKVTNQTYENYLKELVCSPLELKQTYYDRRATIIPHRARGYSRWTGNLKNAQYVNMKQPFAAGALVSAVGDLIRWQRALVGEKLLSEDSYKQMTTSALLTDGKSTNYGLGTFLRKSEGRATVGHGGGINGFRSSLIYYPKSDLTIVVLANCETARPDRISRRIAQLIFADDQKPESKQADDRHGT